MSAQKRLKEKAKNGKGKTSRAMEPSPIRSMEEFKKLYLPRDTGKTALKDLQPREAGELFAEQSLSKVREILLGTGG